MIVVATKFSQNEKTAKLRFDIRLLAERLLAITKWTLENNVFWSLPLGYFGASTGAAAALIAASKMDKVKVIASRGGRPDLAGSSSLGKVKVSTLLLVGGNDAPTISLNQKALLQLKRAQDISDRQQRAFRS